MSMNISRRKFVGRTLAGAGVMASIPAIVSGCMPAKATTGNYRLIEKNNTILFQGDSITDAGREKERELPNNPGSFGSGYAFMAAADLLNALPEYDLTIYNRGISGNKVFQLNDRWQKDCLDIKPDVLSILIGVNDYWHTRSGDYDGTVETYEKDYRALLKKTKEEIPNVRLVICEPFSVLKTSAVDESWVEPMREYRTAARK